MPVVAVMSPRASMTAYRAPSRMTSQWALASSRPTSTVLPASWVTCLRSSEMQVQGSAGDDRSAQVDPVDVLEGEVAGDVDVPQIVDVVDAVQRG